MDLEDLYGEAKNYYETPAHGKLDEYSISKNIFDSLTKKDFMNLEVGSEDFKPLWNEDFLKYITNITVSIGDMVQFSVARETQEQFQIHFIESKRMYLINDSLLNDAVKVIRMGASIVATAFKQGFVPLSIKTISGNYSDAEDVTYFSYVKDNFEITGNIIPSIGLGFFPRHLPSYESVIDKFNFNENDDHLFCPFTALYKQDFSHILPVIGNGFAKDAFFDIYMKCGLNITDSFHLSEKNLLELYRTFAREYKLNIKIKVFYFKSLEEDIEFETKDFKFFNNNQTLVVGEHGENEMKTFYVARMRGHVFNLKGGKSDKLITYLNYLHLANCKYHSLPMKDKDIKKMSREFASEYNTYKKDKLNNVASLLNDIDDLDDFVEAPDEETEQKESDPFVFVYDLETANNKDGKFWIYSYYVSCYYAPKWFTEIYGKIPDDFHMNYKADIVNNMIIGGEKIEVIDSPIITMFNKIVNQVPNKAKVVLYAHNGANFDNIISRELMLSSTGFYNVKEVCTGPNQNIMLSLECEYLYTRNKITTKRFNELVSEEAMKSDFRTPYSEDTGPVEVLDKKKIYLSLRDSKKIIDYRVKDLPRTFGFKQYKLPYDYEFYQDYISKISSGEISQYKMRNGFKTDNVEKNISLNIFPDLNPKFITKYVEILNGNYMKNLEEGEFKNDLLKYVEYLKKVGKYYDPIEYCRIYNKYDVLVVINALKKFQEYINSLESKESLIKMIQDCSEAKYGGNKFQKTIDTITDDLCVTGASNIKVYHYRSLASIVFNMCKNYGVYDNIYKLKGDLKLIIQKSVVGGRVMRNHNLVNKIDKYEEVMQYIGKEATAERNTELNKLVQDALVDFDAVSLYPSAISVCPMPAGMPYIECREVTDKPQIIAIMKKLISQKKKFFICCDVTTRKDLRYPILSEMLESGRNFRNGEFKQIVIGDTTFMDAVTYQSISLDKIHYIIAFPDTCDKFSKLIKCLFNLRLIMKAMGLECQETFKTIMNSSYGRTILKNSEYKTKYKRCMNTNDKKKFNEFLSKNFHLIKPEINCYGLYRKISMKENRKPEGYPHVGSAILEMSKSLMHKTFKLLDDEVFYTDTDSIHMYAKDLHKVESLIGKNMCQFHSDFDPSNAKERYSPFNNKTGIVAIHSVFVMKKCYYDELLCLDKNNKYCIKEHKRVKGVPSGFMDKEKYLGLVDGKEYNCNLVDYYNMMIKKNKNGELIKIDSFRRTIRMT